MKNPSLMGKMDGAADLGQQGRGISIGELRLWITDSGRERATLDKPHAEEVLTFNFTDIVDGDNVRVIELRRGFGLGSEALDLYLTGKLAGENHLQSNNAIEAYLAGAINDAHSALGNFIEQLVIVETTQAKMRGNWSVSVQAGPGIG